MLVLGGARSLLGAVVGAALLSAVEYILQQWQNGSPALGVTMTVPAGAWSRSSSSSSSSSGRTAC
jgi:ABC-type branched-subunit amino acid transport system permease subunit